MSKFCSPLRYPGGKGKLYGYVKELIESNDLNGCVYIEPFAGGANVALNLLFNGVANKIILNDFDRSIYAVWFTVLHHTDELCERIENTEITLNEWHLQKMVQDNKASASLFDLGFSTFYLNRTNRSGIILAGPIGGHAQLGEYKIDCRFNKINLIKRIRRIASFKDHINLANLDAEEFIDKYIKTEDDRTAKFVFFDPPYYKKGPELYLNSFTDSQHLSLSESVYLLNDTYWIVSYDNQPRIRELYESSVSRTYNLTYSAAKKCLGSEVMFYSKNLNIPEIPIYK